MEKIYDWVSGNFWLIPGENDFERGFYTALILTGLILLLIIVLCLIVKLWFRKPAIPGVTLEREDGDIFISRHALSSAVYHLEDDFPGIEILKVALTNGRKGDLELAVSLAYDEKQGSFESAAKAFKARIFRELHGTFGIDVIKTVALHLTRLPDSRRIGDSNDPINDTFVAGI